MVNDPALVNALMERVYAAYGPKPLDMERKCWTVVHEHLHGVMPSEYDVREIDEELYLELLSSFRKL